MQSSTATVPPEEPAPKTDADSRRTPPLSHTPRTPKKQRSSRSFSHTHDGHWQRPLSCIVVVVLVGLALWLGGSGTNHKPGGPFTGSQASVGTSTTGSFAARHVPDLHPPLRTTHAPEAARAAFGSCEPPNVQAAMQALSRYDPFTLFPNLTDVLTSIGRWRQTASAWRRQQAKLQRAITGTPGEDSDEEAAASGQGVVDEGEEAVDADAHDPTNDLSPRSLHLTDLEAVEAVVTFLRVRLTKLQSLFTIINDDDRLSNEKRFELLERLTANRKAAVGVGNYLCTPLDDATNAIRGTSPSDVTALEELALRESALQGENIEVRLGLPELALHPSEATTASAEGVEGGALRGDVADVASQQERIRALQRKLIHTCYVFRVRQNLGKGTVETLFESLKKRINSEKAQPDKHLD